jgi:hypothetical protein
MGYPPILLLSGADRKWHWSGAGRLTLKIISERRTNTVAM